MSITRPEDIEKRSMEIISEELGETPWLTEEERTVLKRVIHTTADFDYRDNLKFSDGAVETALEVLKSGAVIVTDTNMAKTGISKPAASRLGAELHCFMADEDVAAEAKERGITRAAVSVEKAARLFSGRQIIFAVGNAPTALIAIHELMEQGILSPALIIGAPVGFVNILESKQLILDGTAPYIVAAGRKGGSTVAAAICNALLYQVYDREKGTVKN